MSGKKPNLETTSQKYCWWGLRTTIIQLWCGHGFRHKVHKIDRCMSRGQLEKKANIPRDMFSRRAYCVSSDDHWNNICTDPTQYAPLVAYCVCRVHKMLQRRILCMQGTQYATKRSILCRGAFCGSTYASKEAGALNKRPQCVKSWKYCTQITFSLIHFSFGGC